MKKFTFILIVAFSIVSNCFSKNLSWVGSVSSSWSNASNFSPAFAPDSLDTVTVYSGTTYDPVLQGNSKVYKLIMVTGELDLNTYQLLIKDVGDFQGGEISNGLLLPEGNLAVFTGTTFNAKIWASSGGIRLSGSIFNDSCYFENRSSTTSNGAGGNVFNAPLTILHGGSGQHFYMAITNGDVFNSTVKLINQSASNFYISSSDTSEFNDDVTVENSTTGIIYFSRTGGVRRSSFAILTEDAVYTGPQGTGISSIGNTTWSSLQIAGLGNDALANNTFENCKTGISAESSSLNVQNSKFNGVEKGIAISNSAGTPVTIKNNEVNASLRGIDMAFTDFTARIYIKDNKISMHNSGSSLSVRAISMENSGLMGSQVINKILCNEIELTDAESGIFINSAAASGTNYYLSIAENIIVMNDNAINPTGIVLENSINSTIIENSVSGAGTTTAATGYNISASPEYVIMNNYSTGTEKGFYFEGNSISDNMFRGNIMHKNSIGLELDGQGYTGIQDYMANEWTGYNLFPVPYIVLNGDETGAVNLNQSIQGLTANQFTVSTSTQPSLRFPDIDPPNGTQIFNWFIPLPSTESILTYLTCVGERVYNPQLTEIDSLIAIDSISSS